MARRTSLGWIMTLLAWSEQRLTSSNNSTRNDSEASWSAPMAPDWNLKGSWLSGVKMPQMYLTSRWNASFGISSSVNFLYHQVSRTAEAWERLADFLLRGEDCACSDDLSLSSSGVWETAFLFLEGCTSWLKEPGVDPRKRHVDSLASKLIWTPEFRELLVWHWSLDALSTWFLSTSARVENLVVVRSSQVNSSFFSLRFPSAGIWLMALNDQAIVLV